MAHNIQKNRFHWHVYLGSVAEHALCIQKVLSIVSAQNKAHTKKHSCCPHGTIILRIAFTWKQRHSGWQQSVHTAVSPELSLSQPPVATMFPVPLEGFFSLSLKVGHWQIVTAHGIGSCCYDLLVDRCTSRHCYALLLHRFLLKAHLDPLFQYGVIRGSVQPARAMLIIEENISVTQPWWRQIQMGICVSLSVVVEKSCSTLKTDKNCGGAFVSCRSLLQP